MCLGTKKHVREAEANGRAWQGLCALVTRASPGWRWVRDRDRDAGFVFTEPDGSWIHPEGAAKVFNRRVAKSKLPRIRFHDLRHTHAVHLIAAGQHVKVVRERLGHASTSFTMDRYGHVMPNLQSDAASAVAALVDGR